MQILAVWTHDLSPYVVRLSGDFGIRWYGVSYLLGWAIAILLLKWMARKRWVLLAPEGVFDFMLTLFFGMVVGGRLGYVLVYQPTLFMHFEPTFPWWGVLDIAHGGMASHGGMVGLVLACVVWARKMRRAGIKQASALHLMDCVALTAPPGIALGRIANFINGELLGKVVAGPGEPAPSWAVRFPQELLERRGELNLSEEQQTKLAEIVGRVIRPGETVDSAIGRIIEAVQNGSTSLKAEITPLLSARHPSQFYQAFAEGVVVMLVLWWIWRRPRKPGVALAWFLIVYGIGRVATEFWRLPDAHLHLQRIAGLSRGQWLSVGMVAIGAVVLIWISLKSKAQPLGGWSKSNNAPRPA